jgi:lysophospholipase L1-like esterase
VQLALKLVLAPVLVAQALRTRRRALVLPEAAGPRGGVVGAVDGARSVIRIVVAGDSSAAGVGVDHQDHAVVGHLARGLAHRLGGPVDWTLRARSGLTTHGVHALLEAEPVPPADVAIVISGVNDVVDLVPVRRALRHRATLAERLLARGAARHVVFAALPPVHRFPLLPEPLRRVMGSDARRHDAALARWAADEAYVTHCPIDVDLDASTMAPDGFHPGEPVYRACGEALAAHVADVVWPRLVGASSRPATDLQPPGARVSIAHQEPA